MRGNTEKKSHTENTELTEIGGIEFPAVLSFSKLFFAFSAANLLCVLVCFCALCVASDSHCRFLRQLFCERIPEMPHDLLNVLARFRGNAFLQRNLKVAHSLRRGYLMSNPEVAYE
jgi:hypothetical protein